MSAHFPRLCCAELPNFPRGPCSHWSALVIALSKRHRNFCIIFRQESPGRRASLGTWDNLCALSLLKEKVKVWTRSHPTEPILGLRASPYLPISELLPLCHPTLPPTPSNNSIKSLELSGRMEADNFCFDFTIQSWLPSWNWEKIIKEQ